MQQEHQIQVPPEVAQNAEKLKLLRDRINAQCAASGLNSEEIKLIAVSKYFGIDAITEANNHGFSYMMRPCVCHS